MIKYNVKTVNDWLYNSNPIKKLYYNGMVRYRRFVANGQPTPPVFDGKWKATYQDGHVESAQCGSSSEIRQDEINLTNLVSVEIGNCITFIGNGAFYNCTSLTSVTIPNSVTTIYFNAFQSCTSLTSVTIPDSVTDIANGAFQGCNSLTSINIPSGIVYINSDTFYNCTSLTSITIPNSVTSIGDYAFANCISLSNITIPNSVTSIGDYAFANCRSLTSITVNPTTPPTLKGRGYWFDNTNNCPIYVPDASVELYKSATNWSSYASRIKPISEKPQ